MVRDSGTVAADFLQGKFVLEVENKTVFFLTQTNLPNNVEILLVCIVQAQRKQNARRNVTGRRKKLPFINKSN